MSNARQRISKHASLTIEAVFAAWSMQSGYKEVFGSIEQYRTVVEFREASLSGYELGSRGIELSRVFRISRCRIMVRKELSCETKTLYVI
jgi:hypothetical protein